MKTLTNVRFKNRRSDGQPIASVVEFAPSAPRVQVILLKDVEKVENAQACPCCSRGDCEGAAVMRQLRDRIAALEQENEHLTASGDMFADLADRLNQRLREAERKA